MRQIGQYRVEGMHLRGPLRVYLGAPLGGGAEVLIIAESGPAGYPSYVHPNLPAVLEVLQERESRQTVLELPRGLSLDRMLAEGGLLPEAAALALAVQVAAALEHLHRQSPPMVLGCLAPRWVRVNEHGRAVVNFVAVEPGLATAGLRPEEGSGFAAPEADGGPGATVRSDIYSLGMLLAAMTGLTSPARRRLHGGPLAEMIGRATAPEPRGRYENCVQLRAAMAQRMAELAFRSAQGMDPPPVADGRRSRLPIPAVPPEGAPGTPAPPPEPAAPAAPAVNPPRPPQRSRRRRRRAGLLAAAWRQVVGRIRPGLEKLARALKAAETQRRRAARAAGARRGAAPAAGPPRARKGRRRAGARPPRRFLPTAFMAVVVVVLAGLLLYQVLGPRPVVGTAPDAVGPGPWGGRPGMGANAPAADQNPAGAARGEGAGTS